MSSSAEQREHVTEEEIQWTDDKIRWEEDNKAKTNDADHDDESSHDGMIDPFKDPNPLEDTTYQFPNPYFSLDDDEPNNNDDDDNNNNNNKHIEIVLRAYKADSDAIWQSTGLTIWRASEHLCDYLVKHANMFQNKRTLEASLKNHQIIIGGEWSSMPENSHVILYTLVFLSKYSWELDWASVAYCFRR
jgi:hypothetical protein